MWNLSSGFWISVPSVGKKSVYIGILQTLVSDRVIDDDETDEHTFGVI